MIILCIVNEQCAQTGQHFLCASKPLFVLAVDSITMISPRPPLSQPHVPQPTNTTFRKTKFHNKNSPHPDDLIILQ